MSRKISFKMLFSLLVCCLAFSACSSDDENEGGEYAGKSELFFDNNLVTLDNDDVAYWHESYVDITLSIARPNNLEGMDLRYLFMLSHNLDRKEYDNQTSQDLLKDRKTDCYMSMEDGDVFQTSGEIVITKVDTNAKTITYQIKNLKFKSHTLNGKLTIPFVYRN